MPVAVYGASEEIMSHVSPVGKMYQAGTLSGHPLGMAAGYATLSVLEKEQETLYPRLEKYVKHMAEGLKEQAKHFGIAHTIKYAQSMMSIFFTHEDVCDFDSAKTSSREKYARFFHEMLAQGIHLPPSPLESIFISAAWSEKEVETFLKASRKALKAVSTLDETPRP